MDNSENHDSSASPDSADEEGREGARSPAGAAPPLGFEARQPVDLRDVDHAEAIEIMGPAIRAAAAIVGDVDPYPYEQLGAEVIDSVLSGEAARGINITKLCSASRTGRGRVPDLYTHEWELASDLAVRIIVASERSVVYERMR